MTSKNLAWISLTLAYAAAACDVTTNAPSTGGIGDSGVAEVGDAAASEVGDAQVAVSCPRGLVVRTGDFKSTNVALAALDGTTVSASFISSGSSQPGLSMAISGDVALPSERAPSGRVVLLDRFGTNVLTWVDIANGGVLGQLKVGTGFESNPQDYLEVDGTKAYVSRFGSNPAPGKEPFDEGGDLLVINHQTFAVTGRVAMPGAGAILPRPSGLSRIGDHAVVVLARLSENSDQAGPSHIVAVDPKTDTIAWDIEVAGVENCGIATLAPDRKRFGVACSGRYNGETGYHAAASDFVVFDATTNPPRELRRYGLGTTLATGVQPGFAWASDRTVVLLTYGSKASGNDKAVTLNLESGQATELYASDKPFSLSSVWCTPGCSDVCLVADGSQNRLRRFRVDGAANTVTPIDLVQVDTIVGLPPRSLGAF